MTHPTNYSSADSSDLLGQSQIKINWGIVSFFTVYHVLAALALFYVTQTALITFLVMYFITGCLGITMGFHRYFTHRAFKANKFLERLLAISGTLSLQGSILMWVGHHRMHHAGSDTERDPHNANRGFWYSHIGWMMLSNPTFDDQAKLRKFSRDITSDPFLMWLCKPSVMIGFQVVLALLFYALGGMPAVLWGIFFRTIFLYHATWFVNSAAHIWGYKNFASNDRATNNWWVALLSWGEGWHNNHHVYGDSVRSGYKFWEFDITYLVIRVCKFLGWAWDLKYVMPNQGPHSFVNESIDDSSAKIAEVAMAAHKA